MHKPNNYLSLVAFFLPHLFILLFFLNSFYLSDYPHSNMHRNILYVGCSDTQ